MAMPKMSPQIRHNRGAPKVMRPDDSPDGLALSRSSSEPETPSGFELLDGSFRLIFPGSQICQTWIITKRSSDIDS